MRNDQSRETAADLAGVAALLEIAEELGVSSLLDRGAPFTTAELALAAQVPEEGAAAFIEAMVAAGLAESTDDPGEFVPCAGMAKRRYESGYLSWALNANRPYIENAPEFLRDPVAAARKYHRDGRWVAVSSRWVGSQGFYPSAVSAIVDRQPGRIVDLGAGAGGLLISLLHTLHASSGVALDMSAEACAEAERAASRAGLGDRLQVVNRTIESLVEDPSPVQGADVIHSGFAMHDLVAAPDMFDAILRSCRTAIAQDGCLVLTDAVPYVPDPRERIFSALFTYLHASSMGVRLPTEEQWQAAFRRAGFTEVASFRHRMPTARLFVVGG